MDDDDIAVLEDVILLAASAEDLNDFENERKFTRYSGIDFCPNDYFFLIFDAWYVDGRSVWRECIVVYLVLFPSFFVCIYIIKRTNVNNPNETIKNVVGHSHHHKIKNNNKKLK